MRFLSGKRNGAFANEVVTHKHERSEGVRVKHTVNGNSIKMYDKQGSSADRDDDQQSPHVPGVARRPAGGPLFDLAKDA